MFVLSNFFQALAVILNIALTLYFWVIIVAAVLSWVSPDPYNPVVRFIYTLTEPVFYRVRRLLPFTVIGGLDLSPIVVILLIEFLKIFLVQTIAQLGMMI